jgi:hypothetical protein
MAKQKPTRSDEDKEPDTSFLEINEDDLGYEWIRQPKLFFDKSWKLAKTRGLLDESKAALELCYATLESRIREEPAVFDMPKVTDAAVKAKIPQIEEYQEALGAFNRVERKVALLDAAVSALEHKKRALEKLVDLKTMEFYSQPHASSESKETTDRLEQKAIRSLGRRRRKERDE